MKTIAIKVSQKIITEAHGAELHTIISFIKIFSKEYHVLIFGCEKYPTILKSHIIPVRFNYINFPHILRKILHIPLGLINTYYLCRIKKPDILMICGGVFYNGLAILIIGRIFKIKTIIRTAEDHFNYYRYCESNLIKIKNLIFNRLLSNWVLQRADYVLTVGKASENYLVKKGLNKNKVIGIPGPFLRDRFWPVPSITEKNKIRNKFGLCSKKKIVLFVGAISGVKGANELPKIIKKVLKKGEDIFFVIVGKEKNSSKITNQIKSAGNKNVLILDPIEHEKLYEIYQMSDLLIFLTKVGVGYGQVNIEATLCKIPVIGLNPGLDVEFFLQNNCFNCIDEIVDSIVKNTPKILKFPPEFSEIFIESSHLKLLNNILNNYDLHK